MGIQKYSESKFPKPVNWIKIVEDGNGSGKEW